jgi:ferredoxin
MPEMRSDSDTDATETPAVVIMYSKGRRHTLRYCAGETLLETARRGGLHISASCERGECGSCMVSILAGRVHMRADFALSSEDVASGIALACQSIPMSKELEVDVT